MKNKSKPSKKDTDKKENQETKKVNLLNTQELDLLLKNLYEQINKDHQTQQVL